MLKNPEKFELVTLFPLLKAWQSSVVNTQNNLFVKVMAIYVLDTDHLTLYGRNHPMVMARIRDIQEPLVTTAINLEEQLRGRLAQIAEAKDSAVLAEAYQRLVETVLMLS